MQLDENLSIEENIKNTHLNPASSIFEEPNNLLKQEVREPAIYNAVITAIATGSSKMNEISNKIDEETSVCASYIKNLITLGIIKKESPYGEKSSRKTIYSIEDNMFRFWYRFVPENTSLISRGATDLAYRRIAPEISSYMGSARSISAILAVGGERILRPRPKKKLILWEPTKMPLYLASASGLAKKLTVVCLRHLWSAAHCSTIRKSIFTSLRKTDLPRAVSTKQLRGAMSRS